MSVSAESFIVGTIGNIYELRRVGARNSAVIDFSVAVTPRVRNGDSWSDGETVWINASAWGRLAENLQQSFTKGDRIIMQGRWTNKPGYTRDDGTQVQARLQFVAEFAGVDIFFDPARSMRQNRSQVETGYASGQPGNLPNPYNPGAFDSGPAGFGAGPGGAYGVSPADDDFNQPF